MQAAKRIVLAFCSGEMTGFQAGTALWNPEARNIRIWEKEQIGTHRQCPDIGGECRKYKFVKSNKLLQTVPISGR